MAASKRYLAQQLQSQSSRYRKQNCYDGLPRLISPCGLSLPLKKHLAEHPLALEIKATVISNKIINQAGCSFLSLLGDAENGVIVDAVDGYLAFDQILQADAYRLAIAALDDKVAVRAQYQLLLQLEQTLGDWCRWSILHNRVIQPDTLTVSGYRRYWMDYAAYFEQHPIADGLAQLVGYQHTGMPTAMAQQSVLFANASDFPLVVKLATETQKDFTGILTILHDIVHALGLQPIQQKLAEIPQQDSWGRKVSDDLQAELQRIASQILKQILSSGAASSTAYFELVNVKQRLKPYQRIYQDIETAPPQGLLPYVALVRALGSLVED